jgi:hypothetical protein
LAGCAPNPSNRNATATLPQAQAQAAQYATLHQCAINLKAKLIITSEGYGKC